MAAVMPCRRWRMSLVRLRVTRMALQRIDAEAHRFEELLVQDDAGVGRRDIGGHRFTLVADSRSPPPACDAAANGRALVEITDRADPVIAVRHDERESEGEVAANNKNWRQRLSLVDSFQVLVHMRIVAGQKRQFGRPQQVLGGVVHNFRLAEVLDQRADLGIRGDKRKIFPGRLEIRGRPLIRPSELRFAHGEAFSRCRIWGMNTRLPEVNPGQGVVAN